MTRETLSDDLLREIPLFHDFSPKQLTVVRELFVPYDCHPGTVVFEQGDRADHIYLVVSGEVVIRYKPDDGPLLNVTRVRGGGVVGWSALIGRPCYTSSVECTTYSRLLRVNGADLQAFCEKFPELGNTILDRLVSNVAERLRITSPEMYALLVSCMRNGVNFPGG